MDNWVTNESFNIDYIKMKRGILFLMILTFLMTDLANCQSNFTIQKDKLIKIDNYLNKCADSSKFMGYIIISKGENKLFEKGYGFADIENRKTFNSKTLVCICSTGKIFTATLIMKLIQDKKIGLDDNIGKYLPILPYGDRVTIRHLLTHTSGLSQYQENPNYGNLKTCTSNLEFIKNQKLKFNPGEMTLYSTSGMIVLGALIEKLYDKDYISVLKEQIIEPLQMNNTLFECYKNALENNNKGYSVALPYFKNEHDSIYIRKFSKSDLELIPLSAGGQFSCAEDIYKFDKALHNFKIIDKKYVDLMSIKQSEWNNISFGLGTVIDNPNTDYEAVGHGGCSNLYYNHFIKQNFTIILLTIEAYDDVFSKAKIIEKIIFE